MSDGIKLHQEIRTYLDKNKIMCFKPSENKQFGLIEKDGFSDVTFVFNKETLMWNNIATMGEIQAKSLREIWEKSKK